MNNMELWLLMTLLCSAVAVVVSIPLMRSAEHSTPDVSQEAAIYLDQLKEVDRDLQGGSINAPEAKSAKIEIQRRLNAAIKNVSQARPISNTWRDVALAGTAGLIILGSVGLYNRLGSPDLSSASSAPQADQSEMIKAMVARLAAKMAANPQDLDGWLRLMRAYKVLNEPENAKDALTKALAAFGNDAASTQKLKAAATEFGIN